MTCPHCDCKEWKIAEFETGIEAYRCKNCSEFLMTTEQMQKQIDKKAKEWKKAFSKCEGAE